MRDAELYKDTAHGDDGQNEEIRRLRQLVCELLQVNERLRSLLAQHLPFTPDVPDSAI